MRHTQKSQSFRYLHCIMQDSFNWDFALKIVGLKFMGDSGFISKELMKHLPSVSNNWDDMIFVVRFGDIGEGNASHCM